MGWGDELIAAGQAQQTSEADALRRRVRILDVHGRPRTMHPLWLENPYIAHHEARGDFPTIVNGPNARPYIDRKTDERWYWKPYRCTPATLVLQPGELAYGGNGIGVVIEPTVKRKASPNKDWGVARWLVFIRLAMEKGIKLTQLGPPGTSFLPFVNAMVTPDFRHACAVLGRARAYVGHEGGLHHAAAAMGTPAVVLFGGFISPAQTGYEGHRNIFTGGEACGMRVSCQHCAAAMAAITPEQVLSELEAIL